MCSNRWRSKTKLNQRVGFTLARTHAKSKSPAHITLYHRCWYHRLIGDDWSWLSAPCVYAVASNRLEFGRTLRDTSHAHTRAHMRLFTIILRNLRVFWVMRLNFKCRIVVENCGRAAWRVWACSIHFLWFAKKCRDKKKCLSRVCCCILEGRCQSSKNEVMFCALYHKNSEAR